MGEMLVMTRTQLSGFGEEHKKIIWDLFEKIIKFLIF